MLLLGCRPAGRLTEQHDIYFGIATELKDLIPHIKNSWPEAKGNIHIDAWREVTKVSDYRVIIIKRPLPSIGFDSLSDEKVSEEKLFFINLGGYKVEEFDEFHYKLLAIAKTSGEAIKKAKQTAFYKHAGFKGAASHIDDKYGIDIDDIHNVKEILSSHFKELYSIEIKEEKRKEEDKMHLGYLPLKNIG
ncbi:MAG: DUF1543 domain-containing protein [Bacteroidia bacterium]|nr:DUF1543 domain-containing protein [Bacteroidia bacterium]